MLALLAVVATRGLPPKLVGQVPNEAAYLRPFLPPETGDYDFFMLDAAGVVHVNRPSLGRYIKLARPVKGHRNLFRDQISGETFVPSNPVTTFGG